MNCIKRSLFIRNGIILASSAIVIRSISMLFRVFLAEKTGAEGLGLYQLVISIYLVFVTTASSGVCLCTTRLFTELSAKGKSSQARYAAEYCMLLSFIIGLSGGTILFAGADLAAVQLLHDSRAAPSLRLLSTGLPFLAVSSCIRGYFLARRNSLQPSCEQLLEQLIETGSFAVVLSLCRTADISDTCCIAAAGTAAAEAVSFLYSILCYRADIRKTGLMRERLPGIVKTAAPLLLPVSANALTRSGLSAAENALIPCGLKKLGMNSSAALSQYGMISGMAMPVLIFPSVLILPFASLIIPEISEARAKSRTSSIRRITERTVASVLYYSLPVTVILIYFSSPLCGALFGSRDAGRFLAMLAPVVPFMYLDSAVDAILKGLNEQMSYFIFNTIDSLIRVMLTAILVPVCGVYGITAVIIISELLNTSLSLLRLVQVTSFRVSIIRTAVIPCLLSAGACLLTELFPLIGSEMTDMIIKISFCCLVYVPILLLSKNELPHD